MRHLHGIVSDRARVLLADQFPVNEIDATEPARKQSIDTRLGNLSASRPTPYTRDNKADRINEPAS